MEHHEIVIVGGGNAGVSLAARLLRDGAHDIALIESESVHRYRPLLNYVGAGEATMDSLERPAATVMPDGCTWIQDLVVSVNPEDLSLVTRQGRRLTAASLVICTGLEEHWDAIPGLADAYAAGWAGSSFLVESAPLVWPALKDLTGGRVLFSMPPEPAPCSATALKPLFMACDHWQRSGVLNDLDVHLVLPGSSPIGVPKADRIIEETLSSYGVQVLRAARVTHLENRSVTVTTPGGEHHIDDLDYAHVVPHYRAPAWIAESDLAGTTAAGLVDVDATTLQHKRFPSIWSLGDVADLGIKPSGGALRKEVDVLSHNMTAATSSSFRRYNGYTVMPITTARHTLMLVEVDRAGNLVPSLPLFNLVRPRRATWFVDRYALPVTYFKRLLRGKV